MPQATDHNRQAMCTVRRHLRAALEALPLERRRAITRTLLESMIAGIDGEFGTDDGPTGDHDAGWPTADHWHDGPGVRFEGCGEPATHSRGDC